MGGECRIFSPPKYVVLGKRQYDQDYIDGEIEGGIGGCGWKRPLPRPASIDTSVAKQASAPVPKKKGLFGRVKDRLITPKAPIPFVESVPLPPVRELPPPPIPEPKPEPAHAPAVDPVFDFLHPKKF